MRLVAAGEERLAVAATIYNDGPDTAYLGGADVTSSTGLPLPINSSYDLPCRPSNAYAITAAGQTAVLRIVGA